MKAPGGLRFEGAGEVLRPRLALLAGAVVLFGTSLALARAGAPPWGPIVEQALAAWLVAAFAWRAYRAAVRGVVHADASGLRVGDRVIAERARITAAFLLAPESSVVRVALRRAPSIDVRLESEEQARALLTALGLGTGESIATFSALHGGSTKTKLAGLAVVLGTGVMALAAAEAAHRGGLGSALRVALLGVVLGVVYLRLAARVDVGSDGILVRRLLEQRFVSYGAMTQVVAVGPSAIVVRLRSRDELRFTITGWADRTVLRDALAERIEDARVAYARDGVGETAEGLVAPGGRTPGRWVREVRALARARDYRETRLDEERLWRVVDDATAPPATRAGAALALVTLDEPARARLRVAADACAEPKLRVALARVAEGGSDAELEEALTPLVEGER